MQRCLCSCSCCQFNISDMCHSTPSRNQQVPLHPHYSRFIRVEVGQNFFAAGRNVLQHVERVNGNHHAADSLFFSSNAILFALMPTPHPGIETLHSTLGSTQSGSAVLDPILHTGRTYYTQPNSTQSHLIPPQKPHLQSNQVT